MENCEKSSPQGRYITPQKGGRKWPKIDDARLRQSWFWHLLWVLLRFGTSVSVYAKDTINAWGTLKMKTVAGKIPAPNARVTLNVNGRNLNPSGKWGKFTFYNVPTEVPAYLKIEVKDPTSGSWITYTSTYKFHKRGFGAGIRGKTAAGYMGDFIYDIMSRKILRSSRY